MRYFVINNQEKQEGVPAVSIYDWFSSLTRYQWFAVGACMLIFVADVPYAVSVYQRKVMPNICAWGLWTVIALAVVLNYKSSGAEANAWSVLIEVLTVGTITALAVWRKGEWTNFTLIEWISIVVCILSLIGWYCVEWYIAGLDKQSRASLAIYPFILSMIADICACYNVVVASWKKPEDDRPIAWIVYGLSSVVNIGSVEERTIVNYAVPVYLITLSIAIATPLIMYRLKNNIPIREWI